MCVEHRKYRKFNSSADADFEPGICFFTSDGLRIVNYPKQHSANATVKHKDTSEWFKPMVRIFKNMRNKMVADNTLGDGIAPSYYIEGLLYNVPKEQFGKSYGDSFANCYNWISSADRSKFVCTNRQYPLLDGDKNVTWSSPNCDAVLAALRTLWTQR